MHGKKLAFFETVPLESSIVVNEQTLFRVEEVRRFVTFNLKFIDYCIIRSDSFPGKDAITRCDEMTP